MFDKYVEILPSVRSWVRFAKFELRSGDVARSRQTYERALQDLGEEAQSVGAAAPAGADADADAGAGADVDLLQILLMCWWGPSWSAWHPAPCYNLASAVSTPPGITC